jgi:hypothetical protein
MKNKLLVSSALVSGMILSGSAIAQTTITGSLDLSFRAAERTTAVSSSQGFGREAQVNIQNKGTLNNGLQYAAGFALEFDGTSSESATTGAQSNSISNENVYIDFIMGNTTLTFGVDHIQNTASNIAPTASFNQADNTTSLGSTYTNTGGANPKESMGVGIIQNFPGIATASFYFVPNNGDSGAANTKLTADKGGRESAYEVGVQGNFGIQGLNARAFYNKEETNSAGTVANPGRRGAVVYGATYNTGALAIGFDRFVATNTTDQDTTSMNYGISYAVDKNLSVSVNRIKTEIDGTAQEETIYAYGIGYNLGPVAVSADYTKVNNLAYSVTEDASMFGLHLTTKF